MPKNSKAREPCHAHRGRGGCHARGRKEGLSTDPRSMYVPVDAHESPPLSPPPSVPSHPPLPPPHHSLRSRSILTCHPGVYVQEAPADGIRHGGGRPSTRHGAASILAVPPGENQVKKSWRSLLLVLYTIGVLRQALQSSLLFYVPLSSYRGGGGNTLGFWSIQPTCVPVSNPGSLHLEPTPTCVVANHAARKGKKRRRPLHKRHHHHHHNHHFRAAEDWRCSTHKQTAGEHAGHKKTDRIGKCDPKPRPSRNLFRSALHPLHSLSVSLSPALCSYSPQPTRNRRPHGRIPRPLSHPTLRPMA